MPPPQTAQLRPCPKCQGHLILDQDSFGPYILCLNCGKLFDLAPLDGAPPDPVQQPAGTHHQFNSYQDNGCDESPTCLACPLPTCKHDDPAAYQLLLAARASQNPPDFSPAGLENTGPNNIGPNNIELNNIELRPIVLTHVALNPVTLKHLNLKPPSRTKAPATMGS